MQFLVVVPDVTKAANFRWNIADFKRIQGVRHVIYIYFGSSLGEL